MAQHANLTALDHRHSGRGERAPRRQLGSHRRPERRPWVGSHSGQPDDPAQNGLQLRLCRLQHGRR